MIDSAVHETSPEMGVSFPSVSALMSCWRREDRLEKCCAFFVLLDISHIVQFKNIAVVGCARMRYNQ